MFGAPSLLRQRAEYAAKKQTTQRLGVVSDKVVVLLWAPNLGNGANTGSESAVSNAELSDLLALAEFRGEHSVSSSRPIIYVSERTHRVFFAELTEFAAELWVSEFSLPKQYSRNSTPTFS